MVDALDRSAIARRQSEVSPTQDERTFTRTSRRASPRRSAPLAGKLHTGRSRNDQVATDLKLWLMKALRRRRISLVTRARQGARAPRRRRGGDADARLHALKQRRTDHVRPLVSGLRGDAQARRCPLRRRPLSRARRVSARLGRAGGHAAAVDREAVGPLARLLAARRRTPSTPSRTATLPRSISSAARCSSSHLSRLAEDSSSSPVDEAGFAELPDALATGSSRMPQKKNPDVLELARGHAARTIGELTGLLALLKGLPLAYNKDLQLDKEPLFRIRGVLLAVLLPALEGPRRGAEAWTAPGCATPRRTPAAPRDGAGGRAGRERGVPFREAHEIVGRGGSPRPRRSALARRSSGRRRTSSEKDLAALDVRRALASATSRRDARRAQVRSRARSGTSSAGRSVSETAEGLSRFRHPRGDPEEASRRRRSFVAEDGATAAAVFTQNRFLAAPGGPVEGGP